MKKKTTMKKRKEMTKKKTTMKKRKWMTTKKEEEVAEKADSRGERSRSKVRLKEKNETACSKL